MKAPSPGFQANDLDASAAIDMERADTLRVQALALRDPPSNWGTGVAGSNPVAPTNEINVLGTRPWPSQAAA